MHPTLPQTKRPFGFAMATLALILSACGGGGGGDPDPNLATQAGTLQNEPLPVFTAGNDPRTPNQWHLSNPVNAGMDLNLAGVTAQGTGMRVALLDSAVEVRHPDLVANHLFGLSWSYVNRNTDPSPALGSNDAHGTAVTGLLAATKGNSLGGQGVAPEAKFMVYDVIDNATSAYLADAVLRAKLNGAQVVNNSWGPVTPHYTDSQAHLAWADQVRDAARHGRDGKGLVFFMAAGNAGTSIGGRNVYGNLNEIMMIGSVDYEGRSTSFSTPGAQVLLAAPSGDSMSVQEQRLPAITSTDITGARGYSQDDYTNTFQGTSASTPMASGVAALMLQERPELSWRDVRWILAKTARPAVGVTGQASPMTTNGFHPRVGFGRIDAAAAVNMARSHTLLPIAKTCSSNPSTVNKDIPNNSNTGISYQFNQTAMGCNLQTVEYVTVDLAFNHGYTGDLEVVLQSPAGTNSTLTSPHLCANGRCASLTNGWKFGSVRHLGEAAAGDWSVQVRDLQGNNSGSLRSWRITLHGH